MEKIILQQCDSLKKWNKSLLLFEPRAENNGARNVSKQNETVASKFRL